MKQQRCHTVVSTALLIHGRIFVVLTDSCDAAAPVFTGGNFGVMVEAPLSTDPGSHSHEQNEDNPNKSNSGMLLRFSIDAGVTYYNTKDPRNMVSSFE